MKIACLSDLHLGGERWGPEGSDLLDRLVHFCRIHEVDHILICGDAVRTFGDPKNKKHFIPLRTKLKASSYYSYNRCTYVPGNHDLQKPRLLYTVHRNPTILRQIMLKLNHRNRTPCATHIRLSRKWTESPSLVSIPCR